MDRQIYLYQVADNQECMEKIGSQAVVAQTAFNPVIMMELIAKSVWNASGVLGPEAFDPDPFVALMEEYGFPGGLMEMDSGYKRNLEHQELIYPLKQTEGC
jgi:saccharopine dehydrogenase-like NADP-dependent oxidoreductase